MEKRYVIVLVSLYLALWPVRGVANCVNPAGSGGCFASIQAAVDAAAAGETVAIAQGTYFETVAIPDEKDGLTLRGSGLVVLDPDDPNSDIGIHIQPDTENVTIENLTVRNGNTDGIEIDGAGTRLIKVTISGPGINCIDIDPGADNTLIDQCRLVGCGNGKAVNGDADNITILRSFISQCDNGCIDVNGDNTVIMNNQVSVSGDADCINVNGASARVEGNKMSGCSKSGLAVEGDTMSVKNNSVSATQGAAYDIDCSPCSSGLVHANRAFNILDNQRGFDLFASAAGLVVTRNTATRTANEGFRVTGIGIVLQDNEATENGGNITESGFEVSGTGHTLKKNKAFRNHGDGFNIQGEGHLLQENIAQDNVEDGFDIGDGDPPGGASTITLTRNTARGNNAVGIEVSLGATGTTVTGNKAFDNRLDFCDEGNGTVGGAAQNQFGTTDTLCPID